MFLVGIDLCLPLAHLASHLCLLEQTARAAQALLNMSGWQHNALDSDSSAGLAQVKRTACLKTPFSSELSAHFSTPALTFVNLKLEVVKQKRSRTKAHP